MKSKQFSFSILQVLITLVVLIFIIGFGWQNDPEEEQQSQQLAAPPTNTPSGPQLIAELGCNTCHNGLPGENLLQSRAPDLHFAGLRYQPAFLFDYLQNPAKIRQHIGLSRMPDFHLSKEESLALTLFLSSQTEIPGKWPSFPNFGDTPRADAKKAQSLLRELTCLTCHTVGQEGTRQILDLTQAGKRLNPGWVKQYLVEPHIFNGPNGLMPAFFYRLNADSTRFDQVLPDAPEKIQTITSYLASLGQKESKKLEKAYRQFQKQNPTITAEQGKNIFLSQNCAACHKSQADAQWKEKTAPDLSREGTRVKTDWLAGFLKKPAPIRPFGYHPGSGSRMPDFRLSDQEVALLVDYFQQQGSAAQERTLEKLSPFAMTKAAQLIREKLSCLGCHQLGEEGGRIGPNFSAIASRLKSTYVYELLQDPHAVLPQSVMPKIPMPPEMLDLIAGYLLQQEEPKDPGSYLSLTENELFFSREADTPRSLYLTYCAACHGTQGGGNGYNARFLTTPPTNHANGAYMSLRPDDTLFDGVYTGGYILNKSHLMPPWGYTLEPGQIEALVAYMRELCACRGPGWSTDDR